MREKPDPDQGERLARQLDWNLLRLFVAIVQEQGITAAANRLLLKQPTVSNALKRLEETIGTKLIERGPSYFRVTDAGELLYREAVEIYGSVARLTVAVREVEDQVRGHVSIAMASHVIFPALDRALADFSRANPQATLDIQVATSAEVVAALVEKRASLGICLVHERHSRLDYTHMYRERFGFFCGPDHPFFGRRDLTLEDLSGEPSVSFSTDQLHDALRPVALLRTQIRMDDTIRATSSHLEEVRRLIIAGVGIGPLPIHVMERDLRDGLLWQLPPYEDPPAIDIYSITNPAAKLNRAEAAFLEMLSARVQSLPPAQRDFP